MFNAYPWVTLDYLCNFALRNLYSFQSLVNLILLDLYARCLLLLIFRSFLFIKEWLYRWYVCGHYILDVFFEIILHCVDAAGPGVLKMIEVIRKTFLYSPLYIYQFFSEVDSSTFFSVFDQWKCLTSFERTWMWYKQNIFFLLVGLYTGCWMLRSAVILMKAWLTCAGTWLLCVAYKVQPMSGRWKSPPNRKRFLYFFRRFLQFLYLYMLCPVYLVVIGNSWDFVVSILIFPEISFIL